MEMVNIVLFTVSVSRISKWFYCKNNNNNDDDNKNLNIPM